MSSTNVTGVHQAFAGQMTEAELRYCRALQQLIVGALESRASFSSVVCSLWEDLRELRRYDFDVNAAFAAGFKPAVAGSAPTSPSAGVEPSQSPPSKSETEFLKDVHGMIEFASRNGLNFFAVLSILAHDVGELGRHGGSIDRARSESFVQFKATGWARRNAEPVGESEE